MSGYPAHADWPPRGIAAAFLLVGLFFDVARVGANNSKAFKALMPIFIKPTGEP
jgi:hypothetical protein